MIKLGASRAPSATSALIVRSPIIRSKLGYDLQIGMVTSLCTDVYIQSFPWLMSTDKNKLTE